MGYLKDLLLEQKEQRKHGSLSLPDTLGKSHQLIKKLSQELDDLNAEIHKHNSPWEKMKGYLISGSIGAIIGAVITQLMNFL